METKESTETIQYLFFNIGDVKYAVNAQNIQEIVEHIHITKIPKCNKSIIGVINIRGDLIGVVDPKIRLDLGKSTIEKRTALIIFNIEDKGANISVGLIVDLVIEVVEIFDKDILNTPQFGTTVNQKYIENIIRYEDEHIDVLNMKNILNIEELAQI
jgi:purine-binding chemotaxis protein CheW